MKTQVQLALVKLADPRVIRVLLIGLMLALTLLGTSGVVHAEPCGSNTGCSGG